MVKLTIEEARLLVAVYDTFPHDVDVPDKLDNVLVKAIACEPLTKKELFKVIMIIIGPLTFCEQPFETRLSTANLISKLVDKLANYHNH